MKMEDFNINMTQYNRGDIITGTIVMIGEHDVIVSIGGLKEGVFPKEELDGVFKIGDAILVMILGEIDENGCIKVTHAGVNKALADKDKLKNLKVGSTLTFKVNEVNSAGLQGEFMGYRVFLPFSQCAADDYMNKDNLKDRELDAIVIELNNLKKSIVCSSKLLKSNQVVPVNVGDIISGTVIKVEEKYAIVLLQNGNKAKLSITDASYEHIEKIEDAVKINGVYDFKILDTNTDFSRISVGLKQTMKNPLDDIFASLNLGDVVEGSVIKILPVGAVIKLDNGLTAMALTKENSDRANVATHHIYKLNSRVKGEISYINKNTHKINILTNKKKEF